MKRNWIHFMKCWSGCKPAQRIRMQLLTTPPDIVRANNTTRICLSDISTWMKAHHLYLKYQISQTSACLLSQHRGPSSFGAKAPSLCHVHHLIRPDHPTSHISSMQMIPNSISYFHRATPEWISDCLADISALIREHHLQHKRFKT